jgi:hypothetical protein
MTIKETILAIFISSLILGVILGGATLVALATAKSNNYVEEFQNCHISSDGHEMCK